MSMSASWSRRCWLIRHFATVSVILSTLVFGYGMGALGFGAAVPLVWCFVPGAILAPTDAVVVESLLRRAGLPASLRGQSSAKACSTTGAGCVAATAGVRRDVGDTIHPRSRLRAHASFARLPARRVLPGPSPAGLRALLLQTDDDGLQLHFAGARARLLPAGDPRRPVGPDRGGRRGPVPRLAVAAVRHEPRHARVAHRLLVAAQPDSEHHAVPADGTANPRPGRDPDRAIPIVFAIPLAIVSRLVSVAVPVALTGDKVHEKWRATMILTWAGLRGGISDRARL